MPFQCWPTVFDAGPALKPHWVNASCPLGCCSGPQKYNRDLSSTLYDIALEWFVSDREQKVKLMDCLSSPAEITCGVP